ncbi:dynein axonemal intermediate chain 7-like [Schistocerca gregaria]|uniref:dynein axonemal intermediate chain 7-like n=1 Tax=Schistocerca gregaria TaxID=7010 RepID=UPI00211E0CF8|nr:dynein axonemal intermediate chain 7-like [Schistocerca gregaria]
MPPKLSKKQKKMLALEMADKKKQEAEKERIMLIQNEKLRIELDKKAAEEKAVKDLAEQNVRLTQLSDTQSMFAHFEGQTWLAETKAKELDEWEQYMKCDGLPDPANVPQMNTFLYLWKQEDDDIETVVKKTDIILALLNKLEELIDLPTGVSGRQVEHWKEVRNDFRAEQQRHLDNACYKLLSNMEQSMTLTGLNEASFRIKSSHLLLLLWALLPLPRGHAPPPDEPKPIKTCEMSELGLLVQLPGSLADVDLVLRGLHVNYDHYSDLSPSCELKQQFNVKPKDLLSVVIQEWEQKAALQLKVDEDMADHTKQRCDLLAKMTAVPSPPKTPSSGKGSKSAPDPQVDQPNYVKMLQEMPPVKTASQRFQEAEDEDEKMMKESLTYVGQPSELNLRKFVILSGVLHVDVIKQLPQPQKLPHGWSIHIVPLPAQLQPVDFWARYQPPPPPEPGQKRLPEDIEAELRKQEQELNELALISIELPDNVLWFEPPTVVRWDGEKGFWSTEDCHDTKFNEDKQVITFRLGRFGPIGLAAYRYFNLPYQSWEMKPDLKNGGIILSITATVVIVEFHIKGDKVCLNALQNGATNALQDIVGTYFKPYFLIKRMKRGGVDIFPPVDAFCYVEGSAPKHCVAEDHLYHCMAHASSVCNFAWSRWNLLAGRRNMILQMREYLDRRRLANHSTLHATPLKATLVDCTEFSQSFVSEVVPGLKFYADLYHLLQHQASPQAKKIMKDVSYSQVHTVHEMLQKTRVLSYS